VAEVRSERMNSIRLSVSAYMADLLSSFSLTRSNGAHAGERGTDLHDPVGHSIEQCSYIGNVHLCLVVAVTMASYNNIIFNAFAFILYIALLLLPLKHINRRNGYLQVLETLSTSTFLEMLSTSTSVRNVVYNYVC
jgi:hypothetical protein